MKVGLREVKRAESLIMTHRQQYQRPNNQPRANELAWEDEYVPTEMEIDAISGKTKFKCGIVELTNIAGWIV